VHFELLINDLIDALKKPLPGHSELPARIEPNKAFGPIAPNDKTRISAVLLSLYPDKGDVFFPLILRPEYDGTHGGQVAFPGGQAELQDENLARTALREAQEEVGIKAIDVEVMGNLTKIFIPPSNFWVTPYIGFLPYRPDFFPDKREVDKVIEVSLTELINNTKIEKRLIQVRKHKLNTYGFEIQEQWVWGATALMLFEFLEVLKQIKKSSDSAG
jgi:8-oxo-dGTP pyrophosphatase MutT (NUDIX family)